MDIAAILASAAVLVAALAAAFVTVHNAIKRVEVKQQSLEAGQEVIRKDVNSNMANAVGTIIATKAENEALKLLIAHLQRDAGGRSLTDESVTGARVAAVNVGAAEAKTARTTRDNAEHPQLGTEETP